MHRISIIKIANKLESIGLMEEAEMLDEILNKFAQDNKIVLHLLNAAGDDLMEFLKGLDTFPLDIRDIQSRITRSKNDLQKVVESMAPNDFANYSDSDTLYRVIDFLRFAEGTFGSENRVSALSKETIKHIQKNISGAMDKIGNIYADNAKKYGLDLMVSRTTRNLVEDQQKEHAKWLREVEDARGLGRKSDVKKRQKLAHDLQQLEEMSEGNIPTGPELSDEQKKFAQIVTKYSDEIQNIIDQFGGQGAFEGDMIEKIIKNAWNMPSSYLYQACRLLTSWASDAQHVIGLSGETAFSGSTQNNRIQMLNTMKKEVIGFMVSINKDYELSHSKEGFDEELKFKEDYTWNY